MEPQYHRSTSNGRQYYECYDDDADFSAEDIFNIFFGSTGIIFITYTYVSIVVETKIL